MAETRNKARAVIRAAELNAAGVGCGVSWGTLVASCAGTTRVYARRQNDLPPARKIPRGGNPTLIAGGLILVEVIWLDHDWRVLHQVWSRLLNTPVRFVGYGLVLNAFELDQSVWAVGLGHGSANTPWFYF